MTLYLLQLFIISLFIFYSYYISIPFWIHSEQDFVSIIPLKQQLTSKCRIQLSIVRGHLSLWASSDTIDSPS